MFSALRGKWLWSKIWSYIFLICIIQHTHRYMHTHTRRQLHFMPEFWWVNIDAATFDTNDIPDTWLISYHSNILFYKLKTKTSWNPKLIRDRKLETGLDLPVSWPVLFPPHYMPILWVLGVLCSWLIWWVEFDSFLIMEHWKVQNCIEIKA